MNASVATGVMAHTLHKDFDFVMLAQNPACDPGLGKLRFHTLACYHPATLPFHLSTDWEGIYFFIGKKGKSPNCFVLGMSCWNAVPWSLWLEDKTMIT